MVCQFFTGSRGRNFVDWLGGGGGDVERKDNSGKAYFIRNEFPLFTLFIEVTER